MIDSGMKYEDIAEKADVSQSTISRIKKSDKFDPERVKAIKDGLSGKLYEKVDTLIDGIDAEKIAKATAVQLMTAAAIGIDKARLIEGQATSRVQFVNESDRELAGQIAELSHRLSALGAGPILEGEVSTNQTDSIVSDDLGLMAGQTEVGPEVGMSINQPEMNESKK